MKLPSRAKRIVQNNDIIYSLVRPIQRHFGFIKNPPKNLIVSTGFCVITTDNVILDSKFLYYFLTNDEAIEFLDLIAEASTSAYPAIRPFDIENLTIPLPPLKMQEQIAEILSSFDDKIDLLNKQNKTLESLALTLFRHYFIDNPNRNKWEMGKLGDYIEIIDNRGKTPPFTTNATQYPIIEVNALSGDSMLVNYNSIKKYVFKEIYQSWFRGHIQRYDVLFSTVGSIGELAMLLDSKGCIAQNVIGLRAIDVSPFYLYQWLKYLQPEFKEFDIGSVQPSIKVTHFVEKQFYRPDSKTLESFDNKVLPMINKLHYNTQQIQSLQAMRDLLMKAIFSCSDK